MNSPVFSLFVGVVVGALCPHEWVLNGWVLLPLIGFGCLGTIRLFKGGSAHWVSLGAVLWGVFVVGFVVRCNVQDSPALLDIGARRVVELNGIRRLTTHGRLNRILVRDQRGGHWILEGSHGVRPGYRSLVLCHRRLTSAPTHPWDFDETQYMEVRELDGVLVAVRTLSIEKWCGAEGHLHRTMDSGRERVLERIWAPTNGASPGASLLLGLSMGDKSGMSRQARNAFAGLGLAHLTAVSGFHVGMVMLLVSFVFRWLGASRRWVGLLSSPWVWGYAIVCGSSPSALRASAMATLASVMVALGRKPDGMRALAIVGLLLIVDHPGLVHGLGTQLSFLATFGILLWFQSRVERPSKLAALVAIPFWATVFTAPAAWPAFGRFPVGFLPANVLLTPCVPVLAVSAALLVVLPPEASSRLAPLVFAVSDALVQWVVWTHGILPQIELLPNPGLLAFSGAVLASFSLLGLRRNIPVYWGLALVSCLLVLRLGWMAWDRPRFHAGAHGDVVVHSAAGASFHSAGRCGSPTDLKWKTRTLLERVSMGPPLPISHSVGGRIAWSDVALVAKASGDARMWLSSPPSPCESPGPHRLPKRPFP